MRIWLICCLLALSFSLAAQAYRLQYRDPMGAVRNYTVRSAMHSNIEMHNATIPTAVTSTYTMLERVTSIGVDGASIAEEAKDGIIASMVTLPGVKIPRTIEQAFPAYTMTYTRTPLGTVSNMQTNSLIGNTDDPTDALAGMIRHPGTGIAFPEKDVHIGDTWDGVMTMPLGDGMTVNLSMHYTLVGTRVVDGKSYLKIHCDQIMTLPITRTKLTTPDRQVIPVIMCLTLQGSSDSLFDEAMGEYYSSFVTLIGNYDMRITDTHPVTIHAPVKMYMAMTKATPTP